MNKVKEIKRVNPGDVYRERVAKAKAKLPKNWRKILLQHYEEYNTVEGAMLINNVYTGRTADVTLTEIIEKIAAGELTLKAAA